MDFSSELPRWEQKEASRRVVVLFMEEGGREVFMDDVSEAMYKFLDVVLGQF